MFSCVVLRKKNYTGKELFVNRLQPVLAHTACILFHKAAAYFCNIMNTQSCITPKCGKLKLIELLNTVLHMKMEM